MVEVYHINGIGPVGACLECFAPVVLVPSSSPKQPLELALVLRGPCGTCSVHKHSWASYVLMLYFQNSAFNPDVHKGSHT